MSTIFVLYINDDIFGPSLELIRRVCDPYSFSVPHISIRGPIRNPQKNTDYLLTKRFPQVNVLRIGDFIDFGEKKQNTVFAECDSIDFIEVYQKSDFILSPPHITFYDGASRTFAYKLVQSISGLDWKFKINLKKEYSNETKKYEYPKLSKIKIRKKGNSEPYKRYTEKAISLFSLLFDDDLSFELLEAIPDNKRIEFVKIIHSYLMQQFDSENSAEIFSDQHTIGQYNREKKITLGQFATPPELANEIILYIKKFVSGGIDFGDPSIGTGTFFYTLINSHKEIDVLSSIGFEIDAFISNSTNVKWSEKGLLLLQDNFLLSDISHLKKRNLIISNPPYVRHHYIDKELKKEYQKRAYDLLGLNVSGLSSLYIYFILKSDDWLVDNGLAAWLIPSEFMETNYGKVLRSYLTDFVSLISIHRYSPKDLQFDSATVTSCLVVYKKKKPVRNHKVMFTTGGTLQKPKSIDEVSVDDLRSTDKWPFEIKRIYTAFKTKLTLGDFFEIKRGIATGANNFFILSFEEFKKSGIQDECIKPILPNPRFLNSNIIECDELGWPIVDKKLVLIDCGVVENMLHQVYPELYNYFISQNTDLIKERYLVKSRRLWYRQEQRSPAPFLCTYFGRNNVSTNTFRFVLNKSIAVATNAYLLLYPKGELLKFIKKNKESHYEIYKCLQEINNEMLECNGRIYGGGLYKLEPKDLININASNFEKIL